MSVVIQEEAARKEISEWAEYYEARISEDTIQSLLPAVMRGRVIFDEGIFTVELRSPIELANGETIKTLSMSEPSAKDLMYDSKKGGEMDFALKMYSRLTSQPLGVIERIKQRDLITLSGLFGFFS